MISTQVAEQIICPVCGSNEHQKAGYAFPTRYAWKATLRRYRCKACGTIWRAGREEYLGELNRFRHPPSSIAFAVQKIEEGFSAPKVVDMLVEKFNYKVSPVTVLNWARKFSEYKSRATKQNETRTIIITYILDNISSKEIAAATGLSPKETRSALRRFVLSDDRKELMDRIRGLSHQIHSLRKQLIELQNKQEEKGG